MLFSSYKVTENIFVLEYPLGRLIRELLASFDIALCLGPNRFPTVAIKHNMAGCTAHTTSSWVPMEGQTKVDLTHRASCHETLQLSKNSSCKISKTIALELLDYSAIRQAPQQHGCWGACQIAEQYDHFNTQFYSFKISWEFMVGRPAA